MSCHQNKVGCQWELSGEGVTASNCFHCTPTNLLYFPLKRDLSPPTAPATLATSDGSTASYYTLPKGAKELQDLISDRDMNAQIGEIFRTCYRMGRASHSDRLRDARKILFYAKAEVARLEKLKGGA